MLSVSADSGDLSSVYCNTVSVSADSGDICEQAADED